MPILPSPLVVLLALGLSPSLLSAQSVLIPLPDSIVAIPVPNAGGKTPAALAPVSGHAPPVVTRTVLTAAETAASIDFEFSFNMRHFAALESILAERKRVPARQMAYYEPAVADYQAASSWLTGHGFTITATTKSHLSIFASGTVAQVQKEMDVTFARVRFEGVETTSAVTPPSLPASLAHAMAGVNGLQPHLHFHPGHATPKSLTDNDQPYLPRQIITAYQGTGLFNSGIDGAGQSIAIVIDTFPKTSDLKQFWHDAGVKQTLERISFIQVVPGKLPATSGEETLDTEWSSSIAPGAKVRVYAAKGLFDHELNRCYARILEDATDHPAYGLNQMSMSYGAPEDEVSHSTLKTTDQYFAELANLGVTIFASSGDDGADDNYTFKNSGLTPENPASDPNVTGVGGTSLQLLPSGQVASEVVWNNADIGNGATGGGISRYFARPSWQKGPGVLTGAKRQVPDVAAPADPQNGAYLVLDGEPTVIGGTSWSSPTWAGFCALLNEEGNESGYYSLGLLGPIIYPMIGTVNFRDIVEGDNAYDGFGYSAGPGYDLCTGVGVPNLDTLTATIYNPFLLDQTIDFPAITGKTYGDAPFTPVATASSGLAVQFTVASGPAYIYRNQVKLTGAGKVVLLASQAGNSIYTAAPSARQSFIAAQASQSIQFAPLPDRVVGAKAFTLTATASSFLRVRYFLSGPAKLSGNTVTVTGPGTVVVRAGQDGNVDYLPAEAVRQVFRVTALAGK